MHTIDILNIHPSILQSATTTVHINSRSHTDVWFAHRLLVPHLDLLPTELQYFLQALPACVKKHRKWIPVPRRIFDIPPQNEVGGIRALMAIAKSNCHSQMPIPLPIPTRTQAHAHTHTHNCLKISHVSPSVFAFAVKSQSLT